MNNNDKFQNNKKGINYEDEGVIYTPSFSDRPPNKDENKKAASKKPPNKSRFSFFMSLTIISGIIIFVTAFALVKASFDDSPQKSELPEPTSEFSPSKASESESTSEALPDLSSGTEYIGIIRFKDTHTNKFTIYNITRDESADYMITGATEMRSEYGQSIIFEEINEGDLINFIYDADNKLISIKKSTDGFTETLSPNFKIDTENKKIKNGLKEYEYTDITRFLYKGVEFEPEKIDSSIDILTIKGYNNTVWTVTMESGHGEIKVTNGNKIKNGIIEIDTSIYKKLSDAGTIKLSEGSHKIVIKGENIEAFTREISLGINEVYELNLSETEIKKCQLTIKTNATDYILYINGEPEPSRGPLNLEYGSYTIELVQYGYVPYKEQITLEKPQYVFNAELKKEVKLGTLTVTSNPSGAELFIDGTSVGMTPYSTDIVQGQHSITVKKEGYIDFVLDSVYISDKEALYNVGLQKETNQ